MSSGVPLAKNIPPFVARCRVTVGYALVNIGTAFETTKITMVETLAKLLPGADILEIDHPIVSKEGFSNLTPFV
ncbi:MAG TPA: hypothetical protein VK829_03630 [Terriglobales bacterium]|jgi:hypothetical protein|nr:hypothetical protein [Terriglobales bacterium]